MSISRFLREGTWPKKVFHEAIFKPSIKGLIFVSFPLIYQSWCWLHCWIISDLALRYLLMSRLTECSLIDSTFWFWLILSKLSFSIRRSWAWGLGLGEYEAEETNFILENILVNLYFQPIKGCHINNEIINN